MQKYNSMYDFKDYTFPSNKRVSKFPLVAIEGDANEYATWLYDHPEIDRRVPPIYPDFRIAHIQDENLYDIFVHYNSTFTAFCYRVRMNDDTILTGYADYEDINGTTVKARGCPSARASDLYKSDWLENTLLASAFTIIAVQAYMLYFKPDIVEKIYTPSEAPVKSPTTEKRRKRVTAEPIRIRNTKIKRIVLQKQDRPPKNINYRKLSWYVRGHYRHVGKEKKLKYIQPFTCNRGGKKYRMDARRYVLAEEEKEQK